MPPRTPHPPHGLLLGWQDPPTTGRKNGFPTPIWDRGDEGHLITVAPTGAGKGVGCIIPALLTWQGPAIVIDPKGENYAVTAKHRRAMGQSVHVLDPFCITDCRRSDSLNPLDLLGALKTAQEDEMRVIAQAVIQEKTFGKNQDPYWDSRAANLITTAIGHCSTHLKTPSMRDVREVVEWYDHWSTESPYGTQSGSCHHGIAQDFKPVGMSSSRTRTCITSTAIDHLAFIADGPVTASLLKSTIDLKKIQRGDPLTIYIVLPPDKLITHGKLLRLWLVTLMTTLSRRRAKPRIPTLLLADEAAQLGGVKELVSAITLMRGYGVKVWTFWQDISQLRKTYPDTWEAILNNCSIHQYFGASTPMAANLLQDYLADTCPRPVHALKPNQLTLYRPEHQGAVMRIPNYLSDPMFQGLYSRNPFYRTKHHLPALDEDFEDMFEVEEQDGAVVLSFPGKEERNA